MKFNKNKVVCISPFLVDNNQYIERIKSVLGRMENIQLLNMSVRRYVRQYSFRAFTSKKIDVLVLNWHEGLLRGKDNQLTLISLSKFFIVLLVLKLISKKIVYVRHNLYPHGMRGVHAKRARKLADIAENLADVKVSHSGHLCSSGYQYVPHPLYEHVQLSPEELQEVQCKDLKYFLVFGRIERYKNIHELVGCWDVHDAKLVIAGFCPDSDYLKEIKSISPKSNNIIIYNKFLSESDAQQLIIGAEALILNHSENDMIVSGSFFYAATFGVPVLAKSTDFLKWVGEEGLYDGLNTFPNLKSLVLCIKDQRFSIINRRRLFKQANLHFGDDVLLNALSKVI